MTDAIDEKTGEEAAAAAEAVFEAQQDGSPDKQAAVENSDGERPSANAGAPAPDGEPTGADEEDPWAAALAEQEAAEASRPEPVEEPAPASVRGGSAEVFQPLAGAATNAAARDLDIVMNIPVKLNVELGRTKISIRQLLELAQGSVLELDGLAGDPMDILINGYLIAQGEVVVVEERYGIRITDIITPTERVEKLNR